MRTTTLKFVVHGDNYDELRDAADLAISKFLGSSSEIEEDDDETEYEDEVAPVHTVNYELVVSENTDLNSEYEYTAEVIARIKDVK